MKPGYIEFAAYTEDGTRKLALLTSYGRDDSGMRLAGCGGPYNRPVHRWVVSADDVRRMLADYDETTLREAAKEGAL